MKIHTIFATALTVALSVTSCSKQSGDVFTLTSPGGKLELSVQKDSAGYLGIYICRKQGRTD